MTTNHTDNIRYRVTAKRDDKDEFTFYRGPSLDHAYVELGLARNSVDAGNSGWVRLVVADADQGVLVTLIHEEVGL